MTPTRVVLPVVAVVVAVVAVVAGTFLTRQAIESGLYGSGPLGFLFQLALSFLYVLGTALPVLAVLATRLPGVGVGGALVVALVAVPVNALVLGGSITTRPVDLVITLLEVVTVGVVDVVVLLHRGRPLPLVPVLLAVLAVVVLGIVLTIGRYLTFPGGGFRYVGIALRQPAFLVNVFLLDPLVLFVAGALGWTIGRRPTSPPASPAPAAG